MKRYSYQKKGIRDLVAMIKTSITGKDDDYMILTENGLVNQKDAEFLTKKGVIKWVK